MENTAPVGVWLFLPQNRSCSEFTREEPKATLNGNSSIGRCHDGLRGTSEGLPHAAKWLCYFSGFLLWQNTTLGRKAWEWGGGLLSAFSSGVPSSHGLDPWTPFLIVSSGWCWNMLVMLPLWCLSTCSVWNPPVPYFFSYLSSRSNYTPTPYPIYISFFPFPA